jgi:hypothetical protein
MLPGNTASPTQASSPVRVPTHRIGVRMVDGEAGFYDRTTGEIFVPRGNNYIRIAAQIPPCLEPGTYYHSTFNPDQYDHDQAAAALAAMRQDGYNIVRVFINAMCAVESDGTISDSYVRNITRFLELAEANSVFVLLTTDDPPFSGYLERVPAHGQIEWPHRNYMTAEGVAEEGRYWQDLIRALIEAGAAMDYVFGFSLRNEAHFLADVPPLSLSSGQVTTGNGQTYDLSDPADKQRIMDENLVFWIDEVRGSILEVDPTALVGVGFFVPQAPNPARIGDNRLIRTYPAIWTSTADFIDLHAYPGTELTLEEYVENYELGGFSQKPIILGEFGAFRFAYPSAALAVRALQDWQIESCEYGFDGWLLWTWDTDEQTELWNGLAGDGSISDALAPVSRPDPCSAGPNSGTIISRGRPARASRYLESNPPDMAFDGLMTNWWGAGDFAPQWIEVDLQAAYPITAIRLITGQSPDGPTVHRVWVRGTSGPYTLMHEMSGFTTDVQLLEFMPAEPWEGIQFVKVETISSPSWVSWREIEIETAP